MFKGLGGIRKAYASKGDDTTFTRWVKDGRHKTGHRTIPVAASMKGTRFPTQVISPRENLLVSGHSNVKIGRDVRQGAFKGYWIYTLSLEERATCPSTCDHWTTCYGNNMPLAYRTDHTDPTFLPKLEANIERLLAIRGRPGILVRLHALGDFYDPGYVRFWEYMLERHERLAIFGYTAWLRDTEIGAAINKLIDSFPGRAMMRFSNGRGSDRSAIPIETAADCPPGAFVCPEQTEQFEACGKCGACWSTLKNVAFLAH